MSDATSQIIDDTRRWLERAVIGLNLCPFAKAVHAKGQIHYAVSQSDTPQGVVVALRAELTDLMALDAAVRDTTLLILPMCLAEFLEFNDFLRQADRVLRDMGLHGTVQIASFHPEFQFAGTLAHDVTNCTNRSPYPMLHLLREASVDRAVAAYPQAELIFEKNMQTLTELGVAGWAALGLCANVHGKIGS